MLIEPHIHMVSRTTDDYEFLARAGVVAVTEPAFWAGFDRASADEFRTYFRQLTAYEPRRAAQFGIQHYTWLCINPKEAENLSLSRQVIAAIPELLDEPTVLGIGEIGLNKNTRNEFTILEEHLELAANRNQMILVHTPHLADKLKGTKLIVDAIRNQNRIPPDRVMIDHCEEHTIGLVRQAGFWAGLTVYPITKCTPQRAVDILEVWGMERIWVNSAADWGKSHPSCLIDTRLEFLRRGHSHREAHEVFYNNPCRFLSQNPKWKLRCTSAAPSYGATS
jgi:predicted metal-dependent TIM-barrel fold hydrolase